MTEKQTRNIDTMLQQQGVDPEVIRKQEKLKLKDDTKRGMNKKAM